MERTGEVVLHSRSSRIDTKQGTDFVESIILYGYLRPTYFLVSEPTP